MRMRDFPILTFDTYGTLIDWETGIWEAMAPLLARVEQPLEREAALVAYAEKESEVQRQTPNLLYSELLTAVHGRLAEAWGVEGDAGEDRAFGASVGDWPAFDDAAESLAYLKQHHKMITLTNCDQASYRGSSRRLGDPWDAIYTAEDVGSYKPDLANFRYLLRKVEEVFQGKPSDILHIAQSQFHDQVPAKEMGLTTVWVDRRKGKAGGATAPVEALATPDLRVESMAELVEMHRAEA